MESKDQEEWVHKLEEKLNELRQQRIKVDEANESLRQRLQTLTSHLDTLDAKYGKNGTEVTNDESPQVKWKNLDSELVYERIKETEKGSKAEESEARNEAETSTENKPPSSE